MEIDGCMGCKHLYPPTERHSHCTCGLGFTYGGITHYYFNDMHTKTDLFIQRRMSEPVTKNPCWEE